MNALNQCLLFVFLLGLLSCSKPETPPQVSNRYHIYGSWALYETRRVTSSGVEVEPISTGGPVQGLTFLPSGQLSVGKVRDELQEFANWSYYQVDSTQAGLQLRLSTSSGAGSGYYSVGLLIQDDKMVITPPCSEGCYYKLARIFLTD